MNEATNEYPPNAGWFDTPLPDILIRQQEMIFEAERRAHDAEERLERHEEAWSLLVLFLSRFPLPLLPKCGALEMVEEASRYGSCGREAEWVGKAKGMKEGG